MVCFPAADSATHGHTPVALMHSGVWQACGLASLFMPTGLEHLTGTLNSKEYEWHGATGT